MKNNLILALFILLNLYDQAGPLHDAVARRDRAAIQGLMAAGHSLEDNENYYNDWTPLHHAAHNGWVDIVRFLLESGANIEAKAAFGCTPLHTAASSGCTEVVSLLLEKGAIIDAQSEFGWTPLHPAIISGKIETATCLINAGANIEASCNDGNTPLHEAAFHGCNEIVNSLIAAKANVGAQTKCGWTPLHFAAFAGRFTAAKRLIEAGANIEAQCSDGNTPLHEAASKGHPRVVSLLLDNKANLNALDTKGNTALLLKAATSASTNNHGVINLLIAFGADLDIQCRDGYTIFNCQWWDSEIREVLSSDNPYNHPRIIKAKKDHEIFLGRESLRKILGHNVELEKLLMYRESGIKPKSAKLIECGKKRKRINIE